MISFSFWVKSGGGSERAGVENEGGIGNYFTCRIGHRLYKCAVLRVWLRSACARIRIRPSVWGDFGSEGDRLRAGDEPFEIKLGDN